ncbi:MAG: NAD(P)H-dependent oxidoreductase [Acidobacteria bacterium]|nr:NAD(P)H-dependent oxidoreductase [Acidobacteriota bacterium]
MRILVFGAALRAGSYNRKLAALAAARFAALGAEVDHADFREFESPIYDGDLEATSGLPPRVRQFNERVKAAGAFAISTPEYNFSVPGSLKNLIDWSSRERPIVWKGKPGLLLGASPSTIGAQRSLWALRVPLEALGAHLYPDMFSLAQADQKLDASGQITDEKLVKRLSDLTAAFLAFAGALYSPRNAQKTQR